MKIFVYGTLKRSYSNNCLLEGAWFVSNGTTVARCRLYDAGFPVLRPRTEKAGEWNAPVTGEVYEVNPEILARLDRLESEGRMYHRKVKLIKLTSGKVVKAYAYVGDTRFWQHRVNLYRTENGAYAWPAERLE